MDELRLILLLIGAVVIVGVYLYSRRSSVASSKSDYGDERFAQREPRLRAQNDIDDEFPDDLPPLRATEVADSADIAGSRETMNSGIDNDIGTVSAQPTETEKLPEKIIVLNILPVEEGTVFVGADLLDVFDRAGLEYGQYDVFHRIKETAEGPLSVFSVVSATEPGSFDITGLADESFRGLSLFMVLPGPVRGVDAFADMLATARRIAEQIRGEVKDRNRSTLTRQTAHHIREEIIEFEHSRQLFPARARPPGS